MKGANPVKLKNKSMHSPSQITVELELIVELGIALTFTVIEDVTGLHAPDGSVTV